MLKIIIAHAFQGCSVHSHYARPGEIAMRTTFNFHTYGRLAPQKNSNNIMLCVVTSNHVATHFEIKLAGTTMIVVYFYALCRTSKLLLKHLFLWA